ncbi:MAG: SLC13 family permease [Spirochaetales bacterium]|nr:SLC13 family permease [Spirochaetales bacterium]
MLGAIGFIMIAVLIGLLLSEKVHTVVVFCVVPVVFGLIAGFGLKDLGNFITFGVGITSRTAILAIFAILYFSIMSEQGMFDGIVRGLSKIAGKNIVLVFIATALIACFSHLDGASASTLLVTVPAMLPVFNKLKVKPINMIFIISAAIGVMNLMPWAGGIIRVASVLQLDPGDMWHKLLPAQIASFVLIIISCGILGYIEHKTNAHKTTDVELEDTEEKYSERQIKLRPFNLGLTGVLIVILLFGWMDLKMAFFLALSIALVLNYKGVREQQGALRKFAGNALPVAAIMLSAGVFVGVVSKSGMLTEMVNFLSKLIPSSIGSYLHIVIAILAMPLFMILGADSFLFALLPLFAGIGETFGVASVDMAAAMLIGCNFCLLISPLAPTTYLAMEMVGTTLRENLKANMLKIYLLSLAVVGVSIIIGVLPL